MIILKYWLHCPVVLSSYNIYFIHSSLYLLIPLCCPHSLLVTTSFCSLSLQGCFFTVTFIICFVFSSISFSDYIVFLYSQDLSPWALKEDGTRFPRLTGFKSLSLPLSNCVSFRDRKNNSSV